MVTTYQENDVTVFFDLFDEQTPEYKTCDAMRETHALSKRKEKDKLKTIYPEMAYP